MKSPCQNCTKRTVGCHSNCESYINFRNGVDNIKEKMRDDKEYERYKRDVIMNAYSKRRKNK